MARPSLRARLAALLPASSTGDPLPSGFEEGRDSFLRMLLDRQMVSPRELQRFVATETGHEMLSTLALPHAPPALVPEGFIEEAEGVALDESGLRYGFVWPHAITVIDGIEFRLGRAIDRAVLSRTEYLATRPEAGVDEKTIVDTLFGEQKPDTDEMRAVPAHDVAAEGTLDADDAPIIRLLNHIILEAHKERASDVHLEPEQKLSRIRYRVDGMLREAMHVPKKLHNPLVSRIKILAELDIAEKRTPQDGRIQVRAPDGKIDVRVSTIPSVFGEKVVLRLLVAERLLDLVELGFSPEQEERYRSMITRPYGIVLVTGPTGSGKTTTLYSTLKYLNSKAKNIITIEDPVEYQVENISQVQVNRRAGIDFATGLKSILRQDPDIIMVGEMRDEETASIAVKAALTGHLVLSTLHTNDAPGTYARLCDMHIAPYLLASSIVGVVAQRLVRSICPHCKVPDEPSAQDLVMLGIDPASGQSFFRGAGCQECGGSGYRGRSAVYEILTPTNDVKKMILAGTLEEGCEIPGFQPMVVHGRQKVLEGLTSVAELAQIVRAREIA